MIKIAIILFRECLEISFLLGIIIAVTNRMHNAGIYIITGIMLGLVGSSFFAFGAKFITASHFGLGDEIFDIGVMLITVVMIVWTIVWVQNYAKSVKYKFNNLESSDRANFVSHLMLVLLICSTILREGIEIILLIYSIAIADKIEVTDYLLGGGFGAIAGFIFGFLIYTGLIKFSGRRVFQISSILLMLIAAGIAAKAAGVITSAGFINSFNNELWNSSWLIKDTSTTGKLLNSLVGYTAKPNEMQVIFYLSTIISTLILIWIQNRKKHYSKIQQKI